MMTDKIENIDPLKSIDRNFNAKNKLEIASNKCKIKNNKKSKKFAIFFHRLVDSLDEHIPI